MKKRILLSFMGIILCLMICSVHISAETSSVSLTETSSAITESKEDEDMTLSPLLILTLVGLCTAGIVVTVKFTKMKF